jgi:hypothetical protein
MVAIGLRATVSLHICLSCSLSCDDELQLTHVVDSEMLPILLQEACCIQCVLFANVHLVASLLATGRFMRYFALRFHTVMLMNGVQVIASACQVMHSISWITMAWPVSLSMHMFCFCAATRL